jgi:hypothetical protein
MFPKSSIDATQRRRMIGIAVAALAGLAVAIADLASGGRPDPPALRAASTLLDGPWRFQVGDDPRWAGTGLDDSHWETIDMTAPPGSHDGDVGLPDYVAGWMAHGHPGYHGYAWYRRAVDVPAGDASWEILGPTLVDIGYELYWNGQRLGGSGRISPPVHLVATRPLQFDLPADTAGSRGVLAIRTYLPPFAGVSAEAGGMHTPPILAPISTGRALHRAQWARTIAGYIVDAIEPIYMFVLVGLALVWRSRSSRKGFLTFASIALALMAVRRLGNATVAWTDLESLRTYAWLARLMWVPTVAAWTWAWNRWPARPWRSIDAAALVLAIVGATGAVNHAAALMQTSRLASIALLVVIGVRIVRDGPMRILAPVTLAAIMAGLFGEVLDTIGVPGIWFPFGIGVSRTQYVYAVVIVLLAYLMVRTTPSGEGVATRGAARMRLESP